MTQEETRKLLLKDISNRYPYNLWVEYKGKCYIVTGISHGRLTLLPSIVSSITYDECPLIEEVKPCLFPLSSMTEEQEEEYDKLNWYELGCFPHTEEALDYLIENHFDYRGLIDMGLAIDATELNIY